VRPDQQPEAQRKQHEHHEKDICSIRDQCEVDQPIEHVSRSPTEMIGEQSARRMRPVERGIYWSVMHFSAGWPFAAQHPYSFPTTRTSTITEAWQMSVLIKREAVPKCGSFEIRFPNGRPSPYLYWDDVAGAEACGWSR
jgi:hypothetical protein